MSALPNDFSDSWILHQRPAKNIVDPTRPYAYFVEQECTAGGVIEDVATIFLTNKECPFRCLMCDLWKNTVDQRMTPGAIPGQIRWALEQLPPAQQIKLYNSGNFFDAQAIPPQDDTAIARLVDSFQSVIVECHPRLIGKRCFAFNDLVGGRLQVAMGLETVHPEVLARLNKRMTLDDFASAAKRLKAHGIAMRAFILLRPPFMDEAEGVLWAKRSIDFAFDVGVECCAVIPSRGGNGAMERLAEQGAFAPPTLASLEQVLDYGLSLRCGRVFVDLWDARNMAKSSPELRALVERMNAKNLTQSMNPTPGSLRQTSHAM